MTGIPLTMDYFHPLALVGASASLAAAMLILLLTLALVSDFRRIRSR